MLNLQIHKTYTKELLKSNLNPTNAQKLFLYISLLLQGKDLPKEAKDHQLKGELKDCREFHISGDLLVVYIVEDGYLKLLRIGTHSQLFK